MSRIFLALLLVLCSFSRIGATDANAYATSSALSSGFWVQIKVTENAVYKITYEDLKNYGFSNPANVKLYGYGGWILSEKFSDTSLYIDDLPEVSVYVNKGSDGVFGAGDYILFYGRGAVKWAYSTTNGGVFEHENNPYSTYGSYFLKEDAAGFKEMTTQPSAGTGSVTLSVFDDYAVHELEKVTISNTGRELFGEGFVGSSSTQNFSFSTAGITADEGKIKLSFAAAPKTTTPVTLAVGGQTVVSLSIPVLSGSYRKAYLRESWGNWTGEKSEQTTATVTCNTSQVTLAYLNYITLNFKRTLKFYSSGYTFFRNRESISQSVNYSISNATTDCQVWDITENYDVKRITGNISGSTFSFSTVSDKSLHEYAMVNPANSFPKPELVGKVENQNLHALPQTDMIIISPAPYLSYAEQLAERHREESLTVTVVDDAKIFNEFSSGTPDATAYRRFVKMFYDRAVSDSEKPRYLLLFGDGVCDNRHLTNEMSRLKAQNYLLTYQVKESLEEINSYGTDDYFGFLADSDGTNIKVDKLAVGIGRLPVSSTTQAADAVNKILKYMANDLPGNWKSKIIFTADNDDNTPSPKDFVHATQADQLAQYLDATYPEYMLHKYFMDVYVPTNNNGTTSYPSAKAEFLKTLSDGCLLLNYTGHGSTTAWSSEDMLNISDVRQMTYEHLPLWITATCDYGWFDGITTSAGEEAFLNANGGAIALFTTTRVVYSQNNFNIHDKIIRNLFKKDSSGNRPRLGDVLKQSKIELGSDANKLNYILLGDPALTLNYPEYKIEIESVNGNSLQANDTLFFRALDNIAIKGFVTDDTGAKIPDFAGDLKTIVYDSKQTIESYYATASGTRFSYNSYPNQVFIGSTKVTGGEFEFDFTVPQDIFYSKDNGKMIFYASDNNKHDAFGSFLDYCLYGTNEDAVNDGIGPEIKSMYINSESFRNGDNVNSTPFFFASVYDDYGINFSGSGTGHNPVAIIDGKVYYLNDYFSTENNRDGTVEFPVPELAAGKHNLLFRVYDIMNNYSEDSLQFTVVKGFKPEVSEITAYPNPAIAQTVLAFTYNLPETVIDITINIYSISGQLVKTFRKTDSAGPGKAIEFPWDLCNDNGVRLPAGVYVFRSNIKTGDSAETGKAKKLIILKQ
jgi:hypothetical protein